tara:strand:- start:34 stop:300 length:267 start_codon:yes stop_codon:yes gene_type:complete
LEKVNKPTLKAIHICNSLQPPHKPKIAKEYVFANASKFAEKSTKTQQSIKIIAKIVVNVNIVARNKSCSKLKNSTSEIGYYSYTNRCV